MSLFGLHTSAELAKACDGARIGTAHSIVDEIRKAFPKTSTRAHPNVDAIINLILREYLGQQNPPTKIVDIAKVLKTPRAPRKKRAPQTTNTVIETTVAPLPPAA